uniref:diguanylate cyclase domain-containing protein n=1 Tax=Acetatifactor sp. TaxID=1872090 RepID=UPI0040559CFB
MKELEKKPYTIAVMVGDTQSDYSEELMRGFYTGAREEGVNIVLLMGPQMPTYCTDIVTSSITGNYRYQFNSIYQYTHFLKPDAAVIAYGTLSAFNSVQSKRTFFEQFSDIPYIVIEDTSINEDIPYLKTDNYSGMKACVEHLIVEHGYRKIAFLGGPKGNSDAEERLRAYMDAMQENGLKVTDSMIVYGDYTDRVDEQASYLLDHNSGLEAIVAANDAMTKACYRVCTMRNLIVGKDIAITGFDDIVPARTMNPPLTSVSQNSFQISYTALKDAVAMCRGEKPVTRSMPTILKKRCSCGCFPMKILQTTYVPQAEIENFMEAAIVEVADYVFDSVAYKPHREYLTSALREYFEYIYEKLFVEDSEDFSIDYLLDILRKMAVYPYLSNDLVLEHTTRVLQILLANAKDAYSQGMIAHIISSSQQYVHSLNIEKLETEIYISNRKSWFVPTFTRDLATEAYLSNPQNIFYRVMDELQKMEVRSAYFFLFDEPIEHEQGVSLEFPEHIHLVAYFNSEKMKFCGLSETSEFKLDEGCLSCFANQEPACLTSVLLFSERKQYGIMICDVEHADIAFLQICSIQLGTLFHFIELNLLERKAQQNLQDSMNVIKEQNTILSFISEYDELTKLLNRRGFIEKALNLYLKSQGKRAFMIFGDLDHLKQINDIYGHAEGDFAIKAIADRFRAILPQDTICGRIGGDEYVAFLLSDEEGFRERVKAEFVQVGKAFNDSCDKPYYVEMSVGIHEFICDSQVGFEEMMKQSDRLLYEAKANRRANVQK